MEAVITSFRRGRRTQNTRQMIIKVADSKEEAEKFIGKSVKWHAPGKNKKILSGKITAVHGGKGCVRAIFEKGMPGQSLGQKVVIS